MYVNLSEHLGVAPEDLGVFGKPSGFGYSFKVFMVYWQQ